MFSIYRFIILLLIAGHLSDANQISTSLGEIKGTFKKTVNGREIEAFLGIPYAKPPIGNLRFRNPQPFGKWDGVRDASKDSPICIQNGLIVGLNGTVGVEDCLYLNVFTPSTSKTNSYPVMVFIHGGGLVTGSGISLYYGPEGLLDKDIVLVTMNYRLGVLGFASTEDAEMPGNYGLKDQVMALKWVQENIADYGGNSDSVTIFGQSAGGASVHYQMVSPLSKGLFHRAIPMSGSSHCPWAIRTQGVNAERTKKLASLFDCDLQSSKSIVNCLRKIPADEFIDITSVFQIWHSDPLITFSPVIEPADVEGAFLTENPLNIRTSVPMMTGITSSEGLWRMIFYKLFGEIETTLADLDKNFKDIALVTNFLQDKIKNAKEAANKIRKFYFGDKKISVDVANSLTDMYSDSWFLQCTTSIVRSNDGPAYLYLFDYSGTRTTTDFLPDKKYLDGVCHGDELQYLFPSKRYFAIVNDITNDPNDRQMITQMVDLWTNFAIHGNPTPKGASLLWNESSANMNYLNIDLGKTEMKSKLYSTRDKFWRNLIDESSKKIKTEL